MTTIPSDTIGRPVPESAEMARRVFSSDRIKNLTKVKVQQYIESFFLRAGQNFGLLRIVSPRSVHYNADRSFDPDTDPTQRKLQIARYFNDLRAILPCILIVDAGVQAIHQSIGLIGAGRAHQGNWSGTYPVSRKVPLTILIGARDMEEADEMSGIISLLFNECRNLAGGSYLSGDRDRGETWVVVLPNSPVNVDPLVETPINNDPTERVWYTQAAIDVYFEDSFAVGEALPTIISGQGSVYGSSPVAGTQTSTTVLGGYPPVAETGVTGMSGALGTAAPSPARVVGGTGFLDLAFPSTPSCGNTQVVETGTLLDKMPPIIQCPPSISINSQIMVLFSNMQPHYQIALSDSRIATISTNGVLTPKRLGSVQIRVFDYQGRPQNPLLAQKSISITAS